MIVIIGSIVLLVAMIVGLVGVLGNAGEAHSLTENFAVFGYDVTGSTGTVLLLGIVVGVVAMLGMSTLVVGVRRAASRAEETRRELARSRRETAFLNRDLAIQHDHQSAGTAATPKAEPRPSPTPRTQPGQARDRLSGRWSRLRHPVGIVRRDATR